MYKLTLDHLNDPNFIFYNFENILINNEQDIKMCLFIPDEDEDNCKKIIDDTKKRGYRVEYNKLCGFERLNTSSISKLDNDDFDNIDYHCNLLKLFGGNENNTYKDLKQLIKDTLDNPHNVDQMYKNILPEIIYILSDILDLDCDSYNQIKDMIYINS